MSPLRSRPQSALVIFAIACIFSGCISIKDNRSFESYVPDSNEVARMTPDDARKLLQASSNLALSSAVLHGNASAQELSLFSHPRGKDAREVKNDTFDISLSGIRVIGNRLTFLSTANKPASRVQLNQIDPRPYVGTDGWGHLFPYIALNQSLALGGFVDSDAGRQQAKQVLISLIVLKRNGASLDQPRFDAVAAKYRASNPKPGFPEEARKYRVQAEAAVRERDFDGAADLYSEAINVAPWWPEGHFNLALVLGENGDYETAILEMKRYIALVPDAPDARAAQDKIYEWERKAQK